MPESPRWLFIHGQEKSAERIVRDIEGQVEDSTDERLPKAEDSDDYLTVRQRKTIGFGTIAKTAWKLYPKRFVLGLSLFIGQAFLYNAVFFTFALVLTDIVKVDTAKAPWYLIPLAIGNFLGPLLLGRLFDTVGRRIMITATYVLSGLVLILTGVLFDNGVAVGQHPDPHVVHRLLLRLGRRQRRLPHRLGDLPDGDPGDGDRVLLRRRHRPGRHHRPDPVRQVHRAGQGQGRHRLLHRRRPDDRGRAGRGSSSPSTPSSARWRTSPSR